MLKKNDTKIIYVGNILEIEDDIRESFVKNLLTIDMILIT